MRPFLSVTNQLYLIHIPIHLLEDKMNSDLYENVNSTKHIKNIQKAIIGIKEELKATIICIVRNMFS